MAIHAVTPATRLKKACRELAAGLEKNQQRVVFAESCTAGLVAASLASVPGISDYLCGSAVTYRTDTKARWLDVAADDLLDPGPVSEIVARQMAIGVLINTPEATVAAAITGHLGPKAPPTLDGLVMIATAKRSEGEILVKVFQQRLTTGSRVSRQREAAACVLEAVLNQIDDSQDAQRPQRE